MRHVYQLCFETPMTNCRSQAGLVNSEHLHFLCVPQNDIQSVLIDPRTHEVIYTSHRQRLNLSVSLKNIYSAVTSDKNVVEPITSCQQWIQQLTDVGAVSSVRRHKLAIHRVLLNHMTYVLSHKHVVRCHLDCVPRVNFVIH